MKQPTYQAGSLARISVKHVSHANLLDQLLFFNILYLTLLLSFAAIQALQANYHYPNEAAIRTVLRYRNRDCNELLGYVSTYRYSAPRRSKVTDFLRAPSPPPDPTLPDVPLIRLTEVEEMAKRSRIKNLLTVTSTEIPTIQTRSPAAGQSSGPVVALASPAAGQSKQKAHRASKRLANH